MKKLIKKIIIGVTLASILLLPIFKINYYNGKGTEVRRQSIVSIFIGDMRNGTLGTNYFK